MNKPKGYGLISMISTLVGDRMRTTAGLAVLIAGLFIQTASGEEVYRSVDKDGNVTFTNIPSAGNASSERIELPAGPSQESLRQSKLRNGEIRRAADDAQSRRMQEQREKKARVRAAEKQLQEAEARLDKAKVIRDEDRQNLAAGKRPIDPDYFKRVKQAKEAVDEARKALRQARGY